MSLTTQACKSARTPHANDPLDSALSKPECTSACKHLHADHNCTNPTNSRTHLTRLRTQTQIVKTTRLCLTASAWRARSEAAHPLRPRELPPLDLVPTATRIALEQVAAEHWGGDAPLNATGAQGAGGEWGRLAVQRPRPSCPPTPHCVAPAVQPPPDLGGGGRAGSRHDRTSFVAVPPVLVVVGPCTGPMKLGSVRVFHPQAPPLRELLDDDRL
jgi:hypothetical protein